MTTERGTDEATSAALAGEALDNLVSQFSSKLDCLRELVQNSIDAGSPRVDVWLEYVPGEGGEGTIALHVDDYGSGMDEAIIDQQLTRMFASSKEGDLTKIGKFGIGFVSIFALEPQAVLLHTGRAGQFWEVVFHADRTLTRARVDTPLEGTAITLFVAGDALRYRALVDEARATLRRWCRYTDVEIGFEDRGGGDAGPARPPEPINEDFARDDPLAVRVDEEGTQILLWYDEAPSWGFYNKGLTLAELRDPDEVPGRFRHVAFRVKSRYLEHTLSRETVLRDENFEKAMALVRRAADAVLHPRLVALLADLAGRPALDPADHERYERLLGFLAREPGDLLAACRDAPLLRTVGGPALALAEAVLLARREGRLLCAGSGSALTDHLRDTGVPVLAHSPSAAGGARVGARPVLEVLLSRAAWSGRGGWMGKVQRRLGLVSELPGLELVSPESVMVGVALDPEPPTPGLLALVGGATALLASVGRPFRRLTTFVLAAPAADPPLVVTARRLGRFMTIPPRWRELAPDGDQPEAAINREHPHLVALLALADRAPGLAAWCLARALLVDQGREADVDLGLLRAARPEAWPRAGAEVQP